MIELSKLGAGTYTGVGTCSGQYGMHLCFFSLDIKYSVPNQ